MRSRVAEPRSNRHIVAYLLVIYVGLARLVVAEEESQPPPKPAINQCYKEVWDHEKDTIHLEAIKGWVKDLRSTNEDTQAAAIENLQKETGCDMGFDSLFAFQDGFEFVVKNWEAYPGNLEKAISEKVPVLLKMRRKSTWPTHDSRQAASAAEFIACQAPHPAFAPLLREVVKNKDEDQHTRVSAVIAVSAIPCEGVIEFLIETLGTDMAFHAWQRLERLTQAQIHNPKDDWLDVKRRYEAWWRENKDTFVYYRGGGVEV